MRAFELLDRRGHHPFTNAGLARAVVAGPRLMAAEGVPSSIGDVADPVVGELRDDGVPEGATAFDLLAEDGEAFRGHPDDRHVADRERLDRRLPRLPHVRREFGPLVQLAEALEKPGKPNFFETPAWSLSMGWWSFVGVGWE